MRSQAGSSSSPVMMTGIPGRWYASKNDQPSVNSLERDRSWQRQPDSI
ncbi:MAG: hypothetical protein HC895_06555 [Leptolyngbyaceae cyanobacterium SM1_3_5]|nr:hypothetical protein [Leptolyngbyaceae cyanobacterium SM1_3_5]